MSNENFKRMLFVMFYEQNKDNVISSICTDINNRYRNLTFGCLKLYGHGMRFIDNMVFHFNRNDYYLYYRNNNNDLKYTLSTIDIRNFISFEDLI